MLNINAGVFFTVDSIEALLTMTESTDAFICAYENDELDSERLAAAIERAIANYNADNMSNNIFSIVQRDDVYDIVINDVHLARLNEDAERFNGIDDDDTLIGEIMDYTYDELNVEQQYS